MVQDTLHIALFQMDLVWEDHTANLSKIDQWLKQLSQSTDIVFLPEMFTTGFSMKATELAETMDGPTMQWMIQRSRELDVAICGSLIIKENDHYFNRLVFVEPDGKVHSYDKRHLFTMGNEEKHYHKGSKRLIVNYKGWRICPLICYDLRFPVWSRNNGDYDLLVYVANWPRQRDEVWNTLLKARAIENQAYVAGVNRVGRDGQMIHYSGFSQIMDAKGVLLANAEINQEAVLKAELSYTELQRFRTVFPVLKDGDPYQLE
ncbi:MAG TPA: amidohydrolase [Prolixibacteraceae bacterium]|nr:amidohydrolase [Prolixibacteraceae bacterium]